MISLSPWALKVLRSGLVESISADTSSIRALKFAGSYWRTSKFGSRAKTCCMAPAPYTQEIPLVGSGGNVGGAEPSHQKLHPLVGREAALASPETPQPGYSVIPLASTNGKRYGECRVRI